MYNLVSLFGLCILMGVGWLCSSNRRIINPRLLIWGVLLQLFFGLLVFLAPVGARFFLALSDVVVRIMQAAMSGIRFCFGRLASPPGDPDSLGFLLAIQGLPTIIFFAALMEALYFLRVMPFIIKQFARLFTVLMRVSGAESLCAASNIFVGIESATTIRPYLGTMTLSELNTVLTAGLATIASSVMALYVMLLHHAFPSIAAHFMSASLLSAPAALVMSKLLVPETEQPETLGRVVDPHYERPGNLMEAIIRGATAGGQLVMGVIILLIAFLGLVELANMGLVKLAGLLGLPAASLRLESLLAYVFYPLVLVIGVPPADAWEVARLLGMRAILTEIPAYSELSRLMAAGGLEQARSATLAAYALCGFTHIPGVAIFVGGIAALAPNRTQALSKVAWRAFLAATLACLMTAAVAGIFYGSRVPLFRTL